jgi:hypothetical protein
VLWTGLKVFSYMDLVKGLLAIRTGGFRGWYWFNIAEIEERTTDDGGG